MSEVGRPTLYRPEYCSELIAHMSKGLSFESFSAVIDVHRDTLYEWTKVHQEFSDAQKRGQDKARLFWENLGISHIVSESESTTNVGSSSKSLNSAVWIFNMKNRFGWRDKQPGEDAPAAIVNNNQVSLTKEEINQLIDSARAK